MSELKKRALANNSNKDNDQKIENENHSARLIRTHSGQINRAPAAPSTKAANRNNDRIQSLHRRASYVVAEDAAVGFGKVLAGFIGLVVFFYIAHELQDDLFEDTS